MCSRCVCEGASSSLAWCRPRCVCVCVVCQHSSAAAVLGWQGGCVGSGLCRTGTAIIAPAIFSWSAQRWKVPYRPGLMSLVESSAGGRGGAGMVWGSSYEDCSSPEGESAVPARLEVGDASSTASSFRQAGQAVKFHCRRPGCDSGRESSGHLQLCRKTPYMVWVGEGSVSHQLVVYGLLALPCCCKAGDCRTGPALVSGSWCWLVPSVYVCV